ncbi:MAG: hypothetical protein KBG15_03115 [Kofleriaceae bacterium]|nr:hypothetical protein [Kofleriaceae bacterium]
MAAALVLGLGTIGCGTPRTSSVKPSTTTTPRSTADDPTCPVTVPGTTISVEDTATGAAFLFVTTGNPEHVRQRATALATMHNDMHRAMGPLPDGSAATTAVATSGHHHHHPAAATASAGKVPARPAMPMGQMISVHSQAKATIIDQGARVDFISSPNDVAQLQNELRLHAQHLVGGTCEM